MICMFQDQSNDDCLSINNPNDCDQFIDEDCTYSGQIIIRTQNGVITTPNDCQDLCEINQSDVLTPCEYWMYDRQQRVCTLLDADIKKCKGISGRQTPPYNECFS